MKHVPEVLTLSRICKSPNAVYMYSSLALKHVLACPFLPTAGQARPVPSKGLVPDLAVHILMIPRLLIVEAVISDPVNEQTGFLAIFSCHT